MSLLRSKGLLCIDLPVFLLLPEELVLRERSSHHEALHVCPLELVAQLALSVYEDQLLLLGLLEAHLQQTHDRLVECRPPLALIHQHIEAPQAVPNLPQCLNCHSVHCPDTATHPAIRAYHIVLPSSLLLHIIIVSVV